MLLPSHTSLLLVGRVLCQTTGTVSCLWGISSAFHVRLFVRGIVKFPQCHYFLLQLNLWCIPCLVLLPVLELHNFGYWHLMWSDGYLCCGSFLLLPGLSIERLIDDFTAKDTRYSVLSIRVKTKILRHTLESIQYEPAHLILSLAIEFIGSSFSLSV